MRNSEEKKNNKGKVTPFYQFSKFMNKSLNKEVRKEKKKKDSKVIRKYFLTTLN